MTQSDDEAVVRDYLRRACDLMTSGDSAPYLDIWADDAVLEMPFSPVEEARLHKGRAAIETMLEAMMPSADGPPDSTTTYESFQFLDVDLRGTERAGEFVVEMRSEGRRSDGFEYSNRYCGIARARDGKMVLWREFFDPARLPA